MATQREQAPRHQPRPREAELIARWGAGGWRGRVLRAADGATYTVVFEGRPGGGPGPDFRDAVLLSSDGARMTGDIELHLSPAGWRAHGHATDPRYDNVALHVALVAGGAADAEGTPLASGRRAPLVTLSAQPTPWDAARDNPSSWPCAPLDGEDTRRRGARLVDLARDAGWARIRERAAALAQAQARQSLSGHRGLWRPADRAVFIALAEALGYGRDRDALRRCGELLAAGAALGALAAEVARHGVVERRRVTGLLSLRSRWLANGPLAALREALARGAARGAARAGS
ncbi:MAG TPA: DUF2851 family protein [Ktedonobacterales bacterium]